MDWLDGGQPGFVLLIGLFVLLTRRLLRAQDRPDK
jgi:nitrate reductase gamma subunit